MRVKILAAGAFVGLLALPAAAGAKAPPGGVVRPLPEAEAAALVAAPAAVASGSVTRAVSPQEALAAAGLPGAAVSVAPGLSLRQAVGIAADSPASPAIASVAGSAAPAAPVSAAAATATGCASNAAWWEWGTWPYQQRITDTTYWCAVYGSHITYRSSSVSGTGTLCGTGWTSSALISGGIGYSWFVMRSSAGFSCPTVVPWVTLHPSHHLDVSRNAWGNSAIIGAS
jgi:hypothetical protein